MPLATPNQNGNNPEFDNAYWAHQDPAVRKLRSIDLTTFTGLNAAAMEADALALRGFLIDVPIMVWQWEPFKVMEQRVAYGYTWVPAARMPNVAVAPGVTQPGAASYDPSTIPPGAIKVSLDFDDYPPYDAATPAPVVVNTAEDKPKV